MDKLEIKNHYYKNQPFGPFISGLPLPKDPDGVVRNKRFIACDFHPNCAHVQFEGCEFIDCKDPRKEYEELA